VSALNRVGRLRPRPDGNRSAGADHSGEEIAAFVEIIHANLLTGDTPFRRAYIRSVID
jgi:hypothetical protein